MRCASHWACAAGISGQRIPIARGSHGAASERAVSRFADFQLVRLTTLLAAMAVIRLVVYVLRRPLPRATWIGSFERGSRC
jgi:hypothetical protein